MSNFKLTLPSLEYHNCTWTWLDLLMAMKKEYKQAVLSQVDSDYWFIIASCEFL